MESYHEAWLSVHPERSQAWLKERLKEGFHVHHLDGDHSNDTPSNLVLIDGVDHMRLHGMVLFDGILKWRSVNRSRKAPINPQDEVIYLLRIELDGTWSELAQKYYEGVKPSDAPWPSHGARLMIMARRHSARTSSPWPPAQVRRTVPLDPDDIAAMLSRH